jgi:hypothetical protein
MVLRGLIEHRLDERGATISAITNIGRAWLAANPRRMK